MTPMNSILPFAGGRRFGRHIPPPLPAHRMLMKGSGAQLPDYKDLRATCGPIKDQGEEGSCTGHAGSSGMEWINRTYLNRSPILSPQYFYACELLRQGSFPSDVGSDGKTLCEVAILNGCCETSLYPYVSGQILRPSSDQIANARQYEMGAYHGLAGVPVAQSVLGDPVPWVVKIGLTVYASFMSDDATRTGIIPPPQSKELAVGGHEMLLVGYDLAETPVIRPATAPPSFLAQNSWGADWGDKGFCWLPVAIIDAVDTDLKIFHSGRPW